jgi:hypothetical protein
MVIFWDAFVRGKAGELVGRASLFTCKDNTSEHAKQ